MSRTMNENDEGNFILRERLKELRKDNALTQAKVAIRLGIPRSTYCGYEKGMREAGYHTLVELANLFNVSVDYLLGITNKRNHENEKNVDVILNFDGLHWNGIPFTNSDIKLVHDLLENIINARVKKGNY
ncbi:helix-turn-helix transcriptional regulator [Bacillaceae bacterium IKA-2]|nr:helix-turn-helix transcriptional regulator [Bacillaceae bacterium IKA-2]